MGQGHSSDEIISAYDEFKKALSQEYQTIRGLEIAIDEALGEFSSKVYSLLIESWGDTWTNWEDDFFRDLRKEAQDIPKIEDFLDVISWNYLSHRLVQKNTTLEEIQDLLRKKIEEILAKKIEVLDFSFFTSSQNKIPQNWFSQNNITQESNKRRYIEKYAIVLEVLSNIGFNLDSINISEENWNKFWNDIIRKDSYKVLKVEDTTRNLKLTILVCNEESQATYIYDGIFDLDQLRDAIKGENIDWKQCHTIKYNKNLFYEKIKTEIEFISLGKDKKDEYEKKINELWIDNIDEKDIWEIIKFRYFFDKFLSLWEEITWIAIEETKGEKILFLPSRWFSKDIIIWWKMLLYFPSKRFNKKIFRRETHTNQKNLWEMLSFLWYKIADEEQKKKRFKWIIESHEEELKKIWVFGTEKGWNLSNITWSPNNLLFWHYKIKDLRPSNFRDKQGHLITEVSQANLPYLFECLWFDIIWEQHKEELNKKYVNILVESYNQYKTQFELCGIAYEENKWYIKSKSFSWGWKWSDLEVCDNNIETLRYFPSSSFLDKNLGLKNGMRSRQDFIRLLQFLNQKVFDISSQKNKDFWKQWKKTHKIKK